MTSDLPSAVEYRHVDVFADAPFAGNGLIVAFGAAADVPTETLVTLTAEMRQFELIVVDLEPTTPRVSARIFTAEEELPFAGHPVIGAAAALHERHVTGATQSWVFVIAGREIIARSERTERYYRAEMNQGSATVGPPLDAADTARLAEAVDLRGSDLHALPMRVVSTGLPYLIVPVSGQGLERARIVVKDLEQRLASMGAKFVYVFDPERREGRTWDNSGAVEDVATGSAAGPAAAYLAAHGLVTDESIVINQGRFLGRPSRIAVTADSRGELWVGGPVAPVAHGILDGLPSAGSAVPVMP
jgi:PhzF family phenazine biosynthesis protein